ncbi:MAG TPA: DUF5671 domain-containing protein [Candidatus Paceibacterota bacterium]|nr:DUF5671 domain-containing protein [Candidatus Paceibacterota bacterium]
MTETKKLSPLFFFLSIGVLVALIVSVTGLLQLLFEAFNHTFPDVLTDSYRYGYYSYSFEKLRNSLALLIIVFPVFLTLMHFWLRAAKQHLSHWDEVLRRWAIYLVLFLASVMIIADLVTLVRYFVSGEITVRFILKVAVTLIAASAVGWYYIRELKRSVNHTDSKARWFAIGSSVLVLVAIIYGFTVIGGPGSQRKLRLDQRRIDDLQSIQWQVISFWQQKETVPETLVDIATPISSYLVPQDPEFQKGNAYEYRKFSDLKFELCATFAAPMPEGWVPEGQGGDMPVPMMDRAETSVGYPGISNINNNWDHDAGRTCYQREIDPELYPPFPKPEKR